MWRYNTRIYNSNITTRVLARSLQLTRNVSDSNGVRPGKRRMTPSQKKKQAAELARLSFTDIFDFLSHNTPEELHQQEDVDMDNVFQNPEIFKKLTFNQQNIVIEELDSYKLGEWPAIPQDAKRLMYYVSYGNWGPRESFKDPLSRNYVPEDIPFTLLSIKTASPTPSTPITKLKSVNLMSVTKERQKQFDNNVRKLDPASQAVVILGFLVSVLALIRDKFSDNVEAEDQCLIGDLVEEPESVEWINDLEKRLNKSEENVGEVAAAVKEITENPQPSSQNRKWYYLWLR
ncbi:hypothetical protein DASC09_004800 [Saccharomycopsis crataegensis]|uniref:Genetic interactor of prohibitin 7, mitochondrial n=1 Tax=Saccharomycopsis crataegensis TaxID=43959 RepID=A0AAV5QFH0_9ASCO|nr:hypothetical protein DASC09_004800 [Saccharomycopsis crataegensis]